ncbi:HNH endonuclease [Dyella telluris]|uniref:HNH endonuclease n=1 Tax=Dyella telluris TaxID=2763498 RepID=A0A7G8Q8R7_9GAMM|nr:HNH endonuclease [Dyella telluris]QNK03175.1 HNH endonuclease [Dyella telluris]
MHSRRLETTRAQLQEMFGITDKSINNGIFRPKGHESVWLFVTKNKTPDRTQYHDSLHGDDLVMQGQTKGRTDRLIIDHKTNNQELLLFYRESRHQHPKFGFVYEGPFNYKDRSGSTPTTFELKRVGTANIDDVLKQEESNADNSGFFDIESVIDARHRTAASIVRRRGQRKFRDKLLRAYGGECSITRCSIEEILEAAHIHPYKGDQTNVIQNGLLLRADLHTLFDLGLIAIEPTTLEVLVSPKLQGTEYERLRGTQLKTCSHSHERPNPEALQWHRNRCDW